MRTLSYKDLSIYQWVQGFLAIVLMQENFEVIRSMIAHMQSLFTEASFSSWDPAKFAHGCMLTDLEDGIYSWSDGERLAEVRRRVVQLRRTELVQEQVPARIFPSFSSGHVFQQAD
jgi:hypothetical protein